MDELRRRSEEEVGRLVKDNASLRLQLTTSASSITDLVSRSGAKLLEERQSQAADKLNTDKKCRLQVGLSSCLAHPSVWDPVCNRCTALQPLQACLAPGRDVIPRGTLLKHARVGEG